MAASVPSLVHLCLKSACHDKSSVKAWRQKRRTLELLPSELAHQLFHSLLRARLLSATLVELFQQSIQEIDLSGEAAVDGEWMAYVGGCYHLRTLRAADCKGLTNNALWQLTGLTAMEELDLTRCRRVSDEAMLHIVSLRGLGKLGLAETGVGAKGIPLVPALTSLTSLELGGCPVTDAHLLSFQALKSLVLLDLWGSKVTNTGARCLSSFKSLKHLNLAMTSVTTIPQMSALVSLNLCNCAVDAIFDSPLTELFLSGADLNLKNALARNVHLLDLASSRVQNLEALSCLQKVSILDLSATGMTDGLMVHLHGFGRSLRWIDLSHTKVGSEGVAVVAGHVPHVEQLSLSYTLVDDAVFAFLVHFPLLQCLDLSGTRVKGSMMVMEAEDSVSVLSCLEELRHLRRLDLRHTGVTDATFHGLKILTQLSHLHVHNTSLSDECLHQSSSLPNLLCLGLGGAVITTSGLSTYRPPSHLQELDLTGCWLLPEAAVLDFCEAHPQVMVWHDTTVSVASGAKPGYVHKKEYGDLVSGGLATGFSRDMQLAKVKLRRSPVKLHVKAAVRRPVSADRTLRRTVLDERIKYSKQELLRLRHHADHPSGSSISSLRNLEGGLLENIRLGTGSPKPRS